MEYRDNLFGKLSTLLLYKNQYFFLSAINFFFFLFQLLTGKIIPSWVNRLATICVRFPFLAACIPKEWLTPNGGIGLVDLTEWEEIDYPADEERETSYLLPKATQSKLITENWK